MGVSPWRWWLLAGLLSLPVYLRAENAPVAMDQLLEKAVGHRLLLVGEIHGTAEVPTLIGEMAAHMAAGEHALLVGLEIPRDEQKRIDAFLDSAGTGDDRAKLLQGKFWTRDYQDGRSSVAMADLLERLRQLRLKQHVDVLALDLVPGAVTDGDARDRGMAERLTDALDAKPEARSLVLAGNFHTRVQKGAPWDENHGFLGYRLRQFDPYAVEIMGIGGSVWICTGADTESCKARDIPASEREAGINLDDEVNERGHHGLWLLAQTTASTPATQAAPESGE